MGALHRKVPLYRKVSALAILSAFTVPTLVALTGAPAAAHNELKSSTPSNGAVLKAAPAAVTLNFEEAADARFVKVSVVGPGGGDIAAGKPAVSGKTVRQALKPLKAGKYVALFRVVSKDGHPVQGSVSFTATAATPPPATAPSQPTTGAPATPGTTQPGSSQPGASQPGSTQPAETPSSAAPDIAIDQDLAPASSRASAKTRWLTYGLIGVLCLAGIVAIGLKYASASSARRSRND